MSDLPIILSAIQASEARLRSDIQALGGRVGGLEVAVGQHSTRLDRVDLDMNGLGCKLRNLNPQQSSPAPRQDSESAGSGNFFRALEFLTEAPKLWHVVAALIGILSGVSIFAKHFMP